MDARENILLQWNAFQTHISSCLHNVRLSEQFSDVTLACDDYEDTISGHRVILTAGSSFFQSILSDKRTSHPHPLIYLAGFSRVDLEAVMDFLYYGQTRLPQAQLMAFLKTARSLGVKGLNEEGDTEEAKIFNKVPENPVEDESIKIEDTFAYEAEKDNTNLNPETEYKEIPDIFDNKAEPDIIKHKADIEVALKQDQRCGKKSSYWRYFARSGLKAHCSLGGCKNPAVSLGRQGSRINTFPLKMHLQRNHVEAWKTFTREREERDIMERKNHYDNKDKEPLKEGMANLKSRIYCQDYREISPMDARTIWSLKTKRIFP